MAQCLTQTTIYSATGTASNSTHTAKSVVVFDPTTPLATCNTLAITAAEYQDLQHGYVTTRAEAEQIASALLVLLAIAAGIKMIRKALDTGDSISDEKH